MKRRKFLVPFAALAAAFTTSQASATVDATPSIADGWTANAVDAGSTVASEQKDGDRMKITAGEDIFSFVLKKNDKNQLVAWHESHSSHASHSSHSSHYSGYTGY